MGFTPPEHRARSTNSPQSATYLPRRAAVLGLLALALYATSLFADSFVDEYAYITQSYYADWFFGGQFNHPDWLDLFAFDLQPVPKYLIGASLRAAHLRMPGPSDAAKWYPNTHYQFGDRDTLTAARIPIPFLGALGCVALFGCGVLVKDRRVGTIAAVLLMLNPLYALHAHRAMSEVPYEAFLIAALGLALCAIQRIWSRRFRPGSLLLLALAGIAAGLSILCKFNGVLGLIVIGCWGTVALIAPRFGAVAKNGHGRRGRGDCGHCPRGLHRSKSRDDGQTPGASQPLVHRKPHENLWQRSRRMIDYRLESSAGQKKASPTMRSRQCPTGLRSSSRRDSDDLVRSDRANRIPGCASRGDKIGGRSSGGPWSCSAW